MARQASPSLGAILESLPIGIALILLASVPSFFNFATDQMFEEQKALLVRAAALVALPGTLALLVRPGTRSALVHPIALLCVGLVVMLAIATVLGGSTRDALFGAYLRRHGLILWVGLAALFVAMLSAAQSAAGRNLILRALVIGAVWPALYLVLQRADLDVVRWIAPNEGHQAGSTFGNHVFIGGYLALVIPIAVMQAWRSHPLWAVPAVILIAGLVASASRGAILASAAAAAVAMWRIAPRGVVIWVTRAAVVSLLLLFAVPSLRPAALTQNLDPQVGSARVRILIWGDTADIVRNSGARVLVGHGPESLRRLFPPYYTPEIGRWEQIDAMPDRAHNEVLDMLVSAGLIGTALEFALFAVVFLGAIRLADAGLQAALAAAVMAHVIELQFGVATAASRLAFLAIAAVVAGEQINATGEQRARAAHYWWIVAAAVVGALSPWLSTLPAAFNSAAVSGTEAEFIAYLTRLSRATPILYAGLLILAIGLARAIVRGPRTPSAWWQLPALAVAAWLVVPVSIVPARADTFSAAARSYGADGRWPEAAIAYGAAVDAAPYVPDYHDALGRASIESAMQSEASRRDQLLSNAKIAYQRAIELDPAEPLYSRHLAAYFRIRASLLTGTAREEALVEADRVLTRLAGWAPSLTPVWLDWAWVEIDRGLTASALAKLDKALELEPQRGAAQQLRADLLAGRVPVNAR